MSATKKKTSSRLKTEQMVSIQEFEIEMNAKNNAYAFILHHRLLDAFSNFSKIRNSQTEKERIDAYNYLS